MPRTVFPEVFDTVGYLIQYTSATKCIKSSLYRNIRCTHAVCMLT